jgi:hypothetical protein
VGEEVAAGGVWFRSELAGFSEDAWSGLLRLLSLLQASVSKLSASVRSSAVFCMMVGFYRWIKLPCFCESLMKPLR